jgi:hypothetical protein
MEYINGTPLNCVLEESGLPAQAEVILWSKQLCNVLHYLHSCTPTLVHGEIVPANLIITSAGDLMLFGFGILETLSVLGLAKSVKSTGIVDPVAPEHYMDRADTRTDIYSLGVLLYVLAFGAVPDHEQDLSRMGGLARIADKCTRSDLDDRYQSSSALLRALDDCEALGAEGFDSLDYEPDRLPVPADDLCGKKRKGRIRKEGVHKDGIREEEIPESKDSAHWGRRVILVICLVCLAAGGAFYWVMENLQPIKYQRYMAAASDKSKTADERIYFYEQAITHNPTDSAAYLDLIGLFLSDRDDAVVLTDKRSKVFDELGKSVSVEGAWRRELSVNPLLELYDKNRDGYEEVCLRIGLAYWFSYDSDDDHIRRGRAESWLKKGNDLPAAVLFYNIAQYRWLLNQPGNPGLLYKNLWGWLVNLNDLAKEEADDNIRVLMWCEIVSSVVKDADSFRANGVSDSDMASLLDVIEAEASALKEDMVRGLLGRIRIARGLSLHLE